MSQGRRNYRQPAYEKRPETGGQGSRRVYVYGNTVRRTEAENRPEAAPDRQVQPAVRKNRDKARHMSIGYVLFLAAALCAVGFILVNFIQLRAELTNRIRLVAAKERELNSLRAENDEEYNRIVNSVNLEEIRRIAIGELGMTYAQEGQIVQYSNEGNDYMRKVPGTD